jgi:AAA15 family ATPase/GTPase
MKENHLTYFKIENFKRFDQLELTDIGQFNLLVGDNNVGKTSVLEALVFDKHWKECLSNLHKTLLVKGLQIKPELSYSPKGELNRSVPEEIFLRYLLKDENEPLIFRFSTFGSLTEKNSQEAIKILLTSDVNPNPALGEKYNNQKSNFLGSANEDNYIEFYYYDFENPDDYHDLVGVDIYQHYTATWDVDTKLPLVPISITNFDYIPKLYFENLDRSRKSKQDLIENLKIILPNVEDFEVRKISGSDQLLIGVKDNDSLMPVSNFGESVIRAIQVLLEISRHRGKRLMIDEVDTGIHYTRMKDFIKKIILTALKYDVQLFLTTHSLECQQAFKEVFELPDMAQYQKDARNYTLIEKEDGSVIANKMNFEQFQNALDIGYDTRGGAWV